MGYALLLCLAATATNVPPPFECIPNGAKTCADAAAGPEGSCTGRSGCVLTPAPGAKRAATKLASARAGRVRVSAFKPKDGNLCPDTYLPSKPSATVTLDKPASSVDFTVRQPVAADLSLFVRTPDGEWHCDAPKPPPFDKCAKKKTDKCIALTLKKPLLGSYSVFIGSRELLRPPGEAPTLNAAPRDEVELFAGAEK